MSLERIQVQIQPVTDSMQCLVDGLAIHEQAAESRAVTEPSIIVALDDDGHQEVQFGARHQFGLLDSEEKDGEDGGYIPITQPPVRDDTRRDEYPLIPLGIRAAHGVES